MSRLGTVKGHTCLFTHRDPQTGRYWTDDYGKGHWFESKDIEFVTTKVKAEKGFKRKERKRR